jgi:hypothetical protein
MAENFETQWCELRRHATIEVDPKKLLQLAGEVEKRKRALEAAHHYMQFET